MRFRLTAARLGTTEPSAGTATPSITDAGRAVTSFPLPSIRALLRRRASADNEDNSSASTGASLFRGRSRVGSLPPGHGASTVGLALGAFALCIGSTLAATEVTHNPFTGLEITATCAVIADRLARHGGGGGGGGWVLA